MLRKGARASNKIALAGVSRGLGELAVFRGLLRGGIGKYFALILLAVFLASCARIPILGPIIAPPNIQWNDTKWCVPWELRAVLHRVSRKFGKVIVHSTKRHRRENFLKGGASHSYHLKCRAVDFSVVGKPRGVTAYLKRQRAVGGYKYYGGHYHIDNGPRRTW